MKEKLKAKITAAILLVLLAAAIGGFSGCIAFGLNVSGYMVHHPESELSYTVIADTGLNGGALGCGIFGAAALIAFVKVYLAKIN